MEIWVSGTLNESGDSGVYYIGQLPEGKYYLVETAVPTGAATTNLGKVFTLEIKDGMMRELEATGNTVDSTKLVDSLRTWVASQPVTTTPPAGGDTTTD